MAGFYEDKTIAEAIKKIDEKKWVLPTIQRKFVWDKDRICNLFDSLLSGYPIGTLMLWKITKKELFNELNFFTFLQNYKERFNDKCENYKASPTINPELFSVIDGQQRLNSFYIGLHGSYAEKLPHKKWKREYDERIQPKEYLYLNIAQKLNKDDIGKEYDFQFISQDKLNQLSDKNNWFKVSEILNMNQYNSEETEEDKFDNDINNIIEKMNMFDEYKSTAVKILKKLYKAVRVNKTIHYYQEDTQNLDKVIDIFIRANSGGIPLAFSDLVMSVLVGKWKDAGDKIDDLIKLLFAEYGFSVDRDFVLKNCLMIYSNDIKFRVSNFTDKFVDDIEKNFDIISSSIIRVCKFANQIGITDNILRAKYALLPIVYYVNKFNIDIDNMAKHKENKQKIALWLKMALLKGMFGGQPDSILPVIRTIIDQSDKENFPLKEIVRNFENKAKDIRITEDFIKEKVKSVQYGTAEATLLLSLITNMDPQHTYAVDHMYPKSMFDKKKVKEYKFLNNNEKLKEFYLDKNNWNSIGNLQLLNSSENGSKNDEDLETWLLKNPNYNKDLYLIPKDDNGNYITQKDMFKLFFEKRQELMITALKNVFDIFNKSDETDNLD